MSPPHLCGAAKNGLFVNFCATSLEKDACERDDLSGLYRLCSREHLLMELSLDEKTRKTALRTRKKFGFENAMRLANKAGAKLVREFATTWRPC